MNEPLATLASDHAEHVAKIADIALQELGIRVSHQRLVAVLKDLRSRVSPPNSENLDHQLHAIKSSQDPAARDLLFSRLLVNTTDFFREPHHFHFLGKCLRSQFGRGVSEEPEPYRIWSLGCSSGQEPYSIAMCALNCLEQGSTQNIKILGTDASVDCIRKAARAQYTSREVSMIGDRTLRKFFTPPKTAEGQFTIRENVQKIVELENRNLLDLMKANRDTPKFKAIFCRNTLIYFDPPLRPSIFEYLAHCLSPGGFLFVGHSEDARTNLFRKVGNSVYQLRDD